MMYWFGGMGLLGTLMMLLFWAGIVLLLVWVIRAYAGTSHSMTNDAPLDILKRRYAAGEISAAEFEQARRVIEGHQG